ncbi:hypothetical protein [Gilvimarinus chinensis]|uniref:hypothetical protein n=1 Tax=Gilvimarinus chinensis TaxID=396005 RepID=UPI000373CA62|nr:hypothetical protein [Gilvimarinus chinensis]
MRSLVIILVMLGLCWFLTDVRSENSFFNLFMPLCGVLFGLALMVWLVFALASRRSSGPEPTAYDMLDSHDHGSGDSGGSGSD